MIYLKIILLLFISTNVFSNSIDISKKIRLIYYKLAKYLLIKKEIIPLIK